VLVMGVVERWHVIVTSWLYLLGTVCLGPVIVLLLLGETNVEQAINWHIAATAITTLAELVKIMCSRECENMGDGAGKLRRFLASAMPLQGGVLALAGSIMIHPRVAMFHVTLLDVGIWLIRVSFLSYLVGFLAALNDDREFRVALAFDPDELRCQIRISAGAVAGLFFVVNVLLLFFPLRLPTWYELIPQLPTRHTESNNVA
jgi:hypothetical protein